MNRVEPVDAVTVMEVEQMQRYWASHRHTLQWNCLFTLPAWLKVWWRVFGEPFTPYVCAIENRDQLLGIAPLMLQDGTARLMGSDNVCDFLDFIVAPEKAAHFFEKLIRHLSDAGISALDLRPLRPESAALSALVPVAKRMGCTVSVAPHDVSVELPLPSSWEDYLDLLSGKERHEIRRKFRRLENAARYTSRLISNPDDVSAHLDHFFRLFRISRQDKATFLTPQLMDFFQGIAAALAAEGILKLFFLDLDGITAAAAICFDYGPNMYLYNNGYDPQHQSLSIGLLNKILSIKASIEMKKQIYDFMKGGERYKLRLGGRTVQLFRCRIELTSP